MIEDDARTLFLGLGIADQTSRESIPYLTEELGELAKATRNEDENNIREEVADMAVILGYIANLHEFRLDEAVKRKVAKRLSRP